MPSPNPSPVLPHAASTPRVRSRSKTVAAWLALTLGLFGAHRFYLGGWRDARGWLHPLPSLIGLVGVMRMRRLGQDDTLASILLPILGLMLTLVMLCAIVYALTPDETWNARHNRGRPASQGGLGAVLAAILALLLGGIAFMATIAFGSQRLFEWQLESQAAVHAPALTGTASPGLDDTSPSG